MKEKRFFLKTFEWAYNSPDDYAGEVWSLEEREGVYTAVCGFYHCSELGSLNSLLKDGRLVPELVGAEICIPQWLWNSLEEEMKRELERKAHVRIYFIDGRAKC